jgi:stage II sporulation protein R
MEIKEAVTKSLEPMLDKVGSVEETRAILSDNLTNIEELANEIIAAYHFPYSATATIENGYFPLKVYGDVSLPPGEYEALRIELGEALGKNWWCIMFPPLCFVDSTYSVVPESSKEQLQYVLTDEEYDSILIDEESNELIEEDSSEDKVDGNEIDGNETEDNSLQDITNDADDSVDVKVKFKIFTFLNDVFDLD